MRISRERHMKNIGRPKEWACLSKHYLVYNIAMHAMVKEKWQFLGAAVIDRLLTYVPARNAFLSCIAGAHG